MEVSIPELETARRRTGLGYLLLLLVVCLWTGSSFITNALFTDMNYDKPVLTTYLCTATFALYLIPPIYRQIRSRGRPEQASLTKPEGVSDRGAYAPLSRTNSIDGVQELAQPLKDEGEPPLTTRQTASIALMFCAVWFAANVTINAALGQTSVSSVTILSSLSGLFTLMLGALFGIEKFNLTRLLAVIASIIGVILVSKADRDIVPASAVDGTDKAGMQGGPIAEAAAFLARSILQTSAANVPEAKVPKGALVGDLLAIASAACYAIYTLLLKAKTGDESRISMTLFFGFVGAWNILLFWPILLILHFTGWETLEMPQNRSIIFFLAINASITFISDMTMMLSMLMTSPLAVTLGLSLTIPLAVFGDILRGTQIGGITLFIGATLVLGGFVAVGLADAQEKDEEIIEQILGAGTEEEDPRGNGDEDENDAEARQPVLPTHTSGRLSPIAASADTLPPSR